MAAPTRPLVARQRQQLAHRVQVLVRCAPRVVDDARADAVGGSARLGPLAEGVVRREVERVAGWRRLLSAYDVARQLERGYTLTLDIEGRILRSAGALAPGAAIVTRFADGTARSVVGSVAPSGRKPGSGDAGGGDEDAKEG